VESLFVGELADGHGCVVTVDSPVLGEYPRLAPFATFSPSGTVATTGCTLGQHSEQVLREFGYGDEAITDFAVRGVVVLGSGRPVADRPVRRGCAAVPDGGSAAARRRCPCG
jgi:hypothetical protein